MEGICTDAKKVARDLKNAHSSFNYRAHVIEGEVNVEDCKTFSVLSIWDLSGAEIVGNIDIFNCASFLNCNFSGTTFRGHLIFRNVRAASRSCSLKGATAFQDVVFLGCRFSILEITGSRINGDLNLRGLKCNLLRISDSVIGKTLDVTGLDCKELQFENVNYGKLICTPDQKKLFKKEPKKKIQPVPLNLISAEDAKNRILEAINRLPEEKYYDGPLYNGCIINERVQGNISLSGVKRGSLVERCGCFKKRDIYIDLSGMTIDGNLIMPGIKFSGFAVRAMQIKGYINLAGAALKEELDLSGTSAEKIYLNGVKARRVSLAGVTADLVVIRGLQAEELIFDGLKAKKIIGELERWPGIEKCVVKKKSPWSKKGPKTISTGVVSPFRVIKKDKAPVFKPQKAKASA